MKLEENQIKLGKAFARNHFIGSRFDLVINFFESDGSILTTKSHRDILGDGYLSNFIKSKLYKNGVGVWEWQLDPSFFDSGLLKDTILAAKEIAKDNIERLELEIKKEKEVLDLDI